MPKKIVYFVQRYQPKYEAVSKEVKLLADYFNQENKITIFDLHLDGIFKFKFNRKLISFHFFYYPFLFWWVKIINRKNDLSHIYTSLGDLPYLPLLKKKPIILTAAGPCSKNKIQKRIRFLKRLDQIIVETEADQSRLLELGIEKDKTKLIYPPVNLNRFSYQPHYRPNRQFKILYATCPEKKRDFFLKGWNLLLDTSSKLDSKNIFDCPWRYKSYSQVKKMVRKDQQSKIQLYDSIEKNMNSKFGQVDCTIIPYTKKATFVKQMPNSAIESLAAGKPLLISSKVEMAKMVKKEGCGVVFEPNPESLITAIIELKKNYFQYQKKCRKTAEKYFSQDKFIKRYTEIYSSIIN